MTATDPATRAAFRQYRNWRDRHRARIVRQLRGLGYRVRGWDEAERVGRDD